MIIYLDNIHWQEIEERRETRTLYYRKTNADIREGGGESERRKDYQNGHRVPNVKFCRNTRKYHWTNLYKMRNWESEGHQLKWALISFSFGFVSFH